MKFAALFSGGKDSTFAIYQALQQGHTIELLIAFKSENPDSYMFHHPNIDLTRLQAEALGIPLQMISTKGEKEKELADIEKSLSTLKGIDGVTTGALASQYQASRIEAICKKFGLVCFSPSWGRTMDDYWNDLLSAGFKIIVTKVAADGLGKEWLGKEIDQAALAKLKVLSKKHRFHLGFEGGEAETFVTDCPLFKKKIVVQKSQIEWDGEVGIFIINEARAEEKFS